jgi:hypothetical protein
MLRQVIVIPKERLFVNLRNAIHRTESLDDAILLVESWAGLGNDFAVIPMSNSSSGKPHHITSMSKDIGTFRPSCTTESKRADVVQNPKVSPGPNARAFLPL